MEKTTTNIGKVKSFIFIACLLIAAGYAAWRYLLPKTLTDKFGYFELTVPAKFNFIENEITYEEDETQYGIAVYDEKTGIYIFGIAYEIAEGDFKDFIDKRVQANTENEENRNVSEAKKLTVNNYEAYMYSLEYTDSYNEDYYAEIYWIKTSEGYYFIELECLTKEKATYTKDFDEIIKSFKELD